MAYWKEPEPSEEQEWVENISMVLSRAANAPVLRRRAEEFLSPAPANISANEEEARALQGRIESIIIAAGGISAAVTSQSPPRCYDTYVNSALREMLKVFGRARRAVVDAHLQFVGATAVKNQPQLFSKAPTGESGAALWRAIEDDLWERFETAYIRIASFWDRVAQVLDFFYFGIRHFERDGFAAVMDRIILNIAPVDQRLSASSSFVQLREFLRSERPAGYAWLARRRNLLVHNLHLQPLIEHADAEFFVTLHNHLDKRIAEKLKPGTAEEELLRLHEQLASACALFTHVLSLCEWRQNRLDTSPAREPPESAG